MEPNVITAQGSNEDGTPLWEVKVTMYEGALENDVLLAMEQVAFALTGETLKFIQLGLIQGLVLSND